MGRGRGKNARHNPPRGGDRGACSSIAPGAGPHAIDPGARTMLGVIAQMGWAGIGSEAKWRKIGKKVSSHMPLSPAETEYYARMTLIYRNPEKSAAAATGIRAGMNYHTELSELDAKPPCVECGTPSSHYCHINDQYLCGIHVIGHDPNE